MSSLEQLMMDRCPCMMLLVEPASLQIVMANQVAAQTLGYSRETLLGMTITDIESSLPDVFYWEDVRNGQTSPIENQEGLYQCSDASMLAVTKSIQLIDKPDGPLLLIQAKEIENKRRVEDALEHTLSQLRATLEATGNGILVIDWQGRIASMNRLLSTMWGIPEAMLLARNDAGILDLMTSQVDEEASLRASLAAVLSSEDNEAILRLKDGCFFECKSRPQYLGERIVGRVFGFNDITAAKRAEDALRESRDLLEARVSERTADLQAANAGLEATRAEQAKLIKKLEEAHNQLLQSEKMAAIGQLAAGVAHEINNPVGFVNSNLGSLKIYADKLLTVINAYESNDPEQIAEARQDADLEFLREDLPSLLKESQDGLSRVTKIVHDLKDFSHVDQAEHQEADLNAALESTLNVVWNELKYKAEVIRELGEIPHVDCVPAQINQVFMNLLVNAAQAIPQQGKIFVRSGAENGQVWFEVEDTGSGMSAEVKQRIFEPFFTTKPVGKGTGLGLSISYDIIVKKHGGRMTVTSEPGKGSCFRLWLPLAMPKN
ncbi:MAG: ATP-binding protein [Rhodocyclaceae bacterium]|nr:ATP-binding protein [Rhodocyclaceae bacterium]